MSWVKREKTTRTKLLHNATFGIIDFHKASLQDQLCEHVFNESGLNRYLTVALDGKVVSQTGLGLAGAAVMMNGSPVTAFGHAPLLKALFLHFQPFLTFQRVL